MTRLTFVLLILAFCAGHMTVEAQNVRPSIDDSLAKKTILVHTLDSLSSLPFHQRMIHLRDMLRPTKENLDHELLQAFLTDLVETNHWNDSHFMLELEYILLNLNIHLGKYELDQQLGRFYQITEKAHELDHPNMIHLINFERAKSLWSHNQRNKAMLLLDSVYNQMQNIDDDEFLYRSEIIAKYGGYYFSLGDYANALFFLSKAESYIRPKHIKYREDITLFNNLGLAHLSLGHYDKARDYFFKAIHEAEIRNALAWEGIISGNIGHVYSLQGNLEKAREYLSKDVELSLERGAKRSAAAALLNLAGITMRQGNIRLGQELMDSALTIKPSQSLARKSQVFPLLSKIKGYEGDWEASARYLDSSLMVKDSLFKRQRDLQNVRLKQRSDLEKSREAIVLAKERERQKQKQLFYASIALGVSLIFGVIVFILQRRTLKARKLSDRLLLNILPGDVAKELKSTGTTTAQRFNPVTVLFSDFVGFTKVSENLPARELVAILHDYFEGFDRIMDRHGLEKIKTVGDAYLCCAGLPQPVDDHAMRVARAALDMQEFMLQSPHQWKLRVGIHTGPVVAGVVGIKKFAYDVWGDTVNTAARMEQCSEAGKINVSASTYNHLKDQFQFDHRGKIAAKNKGEMDMYFLKAETENQ